ncbi:MAG: hypothetical protein HYZ00_04330, partial [Candidatus Hydrogenedentes bacterium]|nr:hypothetical protein [Candidatus Hydrogenedentota bacterium]
MGKVRYILIMSLLAAAFLAPGVASAQSRAGKGVARAIRGAQSVGRVAKPRGGIRLDRGAALNLPNLGRGLAEASGEHPGISLFRDAALQSSPRGPMPQRHGVRVPQNAGRSAYGRGSGRDYGRGYSGNYDLSALGELAQQYLPYAYGNGYGNGYPGYYDQYYDHHDEMADAYRDAAIANSIVNLVGIVASAALQDQGRAYPVSPAPAP